MQEYIHLPDASLGDTEYTIKDASSNLTIEFTGETYDGEWHNIRIGLTGRELALFVDRLRRLVVLFPR